MRRILAVTSGRADATPLEPVIERLTCEGFYIGWADLISVAPASCMRALEPEIVDHRPDLMLLLGDRYESLAAALLATTLQMPIAHIHGGEASFGSFDNQIRDAITKLAHIHFVAAPEFKLRLVEGLGEHPERVHVVGAPGLDNLTDLPPRTKEKRFVCTYHPATLGESDLPALLGALDRFPDYEQIWTGVNNDPGSDRIRAALADRDVCDLSPREYIDLCRRSAAVVGNSSSGIIEAPYMEVPTVNVGSRQDGRLKGPSVFDCSGQAIETGIRRALEYEGSFESRYGQPGASKNIADILATAEIDMVKRWAV